MNGANNQDDLKISDLDFSDLYQNSHIQLSLADLISKNEENKPIIAAHPLDCNNISELPESIISQEDKEEMNKVLNKKSQRDESAKLSKNEVKKQLKELSKNAVKEEFDTMFALVDTRKRPVLYIRWMPKDDELFAATRSNHKGHFVCLYFFHHNSEKSILIANPNGRAISDECEAEVINSYLEKNGKMTIYQSRDYFQFGNTDCGSGALIFLRMLYNMDKKNFFDVLKEGQYKKKEGKNLLDHSSIEFNNFLKKEIERRIGETIEGKTEDYISQKLRHADYATAKVCKEHNDAIKDSNCTAIALAGIPFDQKLVDGLDKDQAQLSSNILLSGKQLLTPEQVQQKSREMLGTKKQKNVRFQTPNENKSNKPELHNSAQDYKPAGKCGLSMGLMVASTFATIFFAFFLSKGDTDLGKKICGAGLAVSILVFVSTIAYLCLRKAPDSKMTIATENTPVFKTTAVNQQPKTKCT